MTEEKPVLTEADLAAIERVFAKTSDDIFISIARAFERLEERIDAMESRLYARLAEIDDAIYAQKKD